MTLHPLRFQPKFRRYLWGGRRLGELLGKPIGPEADYAESWEVVDHGVDQSVVAHGECAGKSLGELVTNRGLELLGRHYPRPSFPLLFKFLDASTNLSVQVHPDDRAAALQDPPDLGKTEAWVIVDAAPGSFVYAGLKRGFDRAALEREVAGGTTELALHRLAVKSGDCIFIPAGIVHAIGGGVLVAEIQQASDTTYRLFDWNRVGADGKPRPLHVEQALAVTNFDAGPIAARIPAGTDRDHVERLVSCDKFTLDRWKFGASETIGGDNRFHIVAVLQGALRVEGDPANTLLARGQACLLPASYRGQLTPTGNVVLLDMYL